MTGYGKARYENDFVASVEIKSLNSKFLDASIRLPRIFSDKEIEVRGNLSNLLVRGKVNVFVEFESNDESTSKITLRKELFGNYYQELKDLANDLGADDRDLFRLTMQIPDVMKSENDTEKVEEYWAQISELIVEAAETCDAFRIKEGEKLLMYLEDCLSKIEELSLEVKQLDPGRIDKIREKIKGNLEEFISEENIDKNRFEQELIFYIEKIDINEELIRLSTHLNHFRDALNSSDSNGKKLGFIAQEIGREINTIGSKANDSGIQTLVINMKEELEKIKEQVLNIL